MDVLTQTRSEFSTIKKILSLTNILSELGQVWIWDGAGPDISKQSHRMYTTLTLKIGTDVDRIRSGVCERILEQ